MNLIIDVGNSRVKMAVFSNQRIIKKSKTTHNAFYTEFQGLITKYKGVGKIIFSSVGSINLKELSSLNQEIVVLSHKLNFPFKNLYKTPKTLGVDRLALVSASVKDFKNKNVLIIDAGTCITYDFINKKNEYFGGAISPGLYTRYSSLNNLTANLPLLKPRVPNHYIGNSTKQAIHSGVVNGVLQEIDGVINQYNENYEDLTVILTGGDAKFLSKQLKNTIFANSNFLLEGLNYLLEYNT